MKKEKYSLKFVNNGKAFLMPDWTVEKQEALLDVMSKYDDLQEKNIKEFNRIWRVELILLSLHEIDDSVTKENIIKLHPDDFLELATTVYDAGRKGILSVDFQKAGGKEKTS